jgi:hypothetical protein
MDRGSEAWWDGDAHTATCLACKVDAPADPFAGVDRDLRGTPGGSAQAEADRKNQAGHSQRSTEPWEKGSDGERLLSRYLHEEAGRGQLLILDDRQIPGTKANIDLIAVAPSGVYVIDAKNYQGKVELRASGFGRWRQEQLVVKGRDRTHLADNMERQIAAVREAFDSAHVGSGVSIHAVLCFVGAEWDLFFSAFTVNGVHVVAPQPLRRRLRKEGPLDAGRRDQVARLLSLRLPPAVPSTGAMAGRGAPR